MFQVALLVEHSLTPEESPGVFALNQDPVVAVLLDEPSPISKDKYIPTPLFVSHVPEVSPLIVIVLYSQVFAALIV